MALLLGTDSARPTPELLMTRLKTQLTPLTPPGLMTNLSACLFL